MRNYFSKIISLAYSIFCFFAIWAQKNVQSPQNLRQSVIPPHSYRYTLQILRLSHRIKLISQLLDTPRQICHRRDCKMSEHRDSTIPVFFASIFYLFFLSSISLWIENIKLFHNLKNLHFILPWNWSNN